MSPGPRTGMSYKVLNTLGGGGEDKKFKTVLNKRW